MTTLTRAPAGEYLIHSRPSPPCVLSRTASSQVRRCYWIASVLAKQQSIGWERQRWIESLPSAPHSWSYPQRLEQCKRRLHGLFGAFSFSRNSRLAGWQAGRCRLLRFLLHHRRRRCDLLLAFRLPSRPRNMTTVRPRKANCYSELQHVVCTAMTLASGGGSGMEGPSRARSSRRQPVSTW